MTETSLAYRVYNQVQPEVATGRRICPCHANVAYELAFDEGPDGELLDVNCLAGCTAAPIAAKLPAP